VGRGQYLDLPLERAEPLLVRADYVREQVEQTVRRILRRLSSRYGGVDIFSIRFPHHAYGTGMSQIAVFLRNQLRDRGIPTEYLAVGVSSVMSRDFRSRLWRCSGLKEAVIFIDEVDLLFSPELKEEEQRRLLEVFANIVIEYSENLSARGVVRQVLVLVLSYNAKRKTEEFASSRLGRRLMQELLSVDIPLSREDFRELMTTVSTLYAHRHRLSGQALWPLLSFINSYAGCTISRSGVNVGGFRTDCLYSVTLGVIEVGRYLIEVTAAHELDSRKREQLERFASRYPTLLIHLLEGFLGSSRGSRQTPWPTSWRMISSWATRLEPSSGGTPSLWRTAGSLSRG